MRKYNHTQETIELFNKVLNDYNNIQSDSDLEKRNISYSDYQSLGFLVDCLRYSGETSTHTESIRVYFKNLGCVIEECNNVYIVKLKLT